MSKVSYPTSVVVGLAGPKAQPKGDSRWRTGQYSRAPGVPFVRRGDAWSERGSLTDEIGRADARKVGKPALRQG